MALKLNFLGTRGSVAVDDPKYRLYGGSTMCAVVNANGTNIVFDAGSGFLEIRNYIEFDEDNKACIHLFISHTHFDHVMGIVACDIMFDPNVTVHIYGAVRENLSVKQQIDKFMSAPNWPVNSDIFKANVHYHDIKDTITVGDVKIVCAEGRHPGGCTIYKAFFENKCIVYATDYEIKEDNIDYLINFSKDADILICDGQYSRNELELKAGFGHSCWEDAIIVAKKANCKKLYIIHHDPYSNDDCLFDIETTQIKESKKFVFAKKGEEIIV